MLVIAIQAASVCNNRTLLSRYVVWLYNKAACMEGFITHTEQRDLMIANSGDKSIHCLFIKRVGLYKGTTTNTQSGMQASSVPKAKIGTCIAVIPINLQEVLLVTHE